MIHFNMNTAPSSKYVLRHKNIRQFIKILSLMEGPKAIKNANVTRIDLTYPLKTLFHRVYRRTNKNITYKRRMKFQH